MTMLPLKAHVKNGRLVLDEPTDLPEGDEIDLVPLDEVLATSGSRPSPRTASPRACEASPSGSKASPRAQTSFPRSCHASPRACVRGSWVVETKSVAPRDTTNKPN
jgi:hypothetical protein